MFRQTVISPYPSDKRALISRDAIFRGAPRGRVLRRAAGVLCAAWMSVPLLCSAHPRDYVVSVTATVQDSPGQIALQWPAYPSAASYRVYRAWGEVAYLTNSPGTITGWTDTNVTAGTVYEYQVLRNSGSISAYGYTMSAIRRPMVDNRGKIVLVVDNTQAPALTNELERLQMDLVGDGWTVIRHDVARKNWNDVGWKEAVTNVKAMIKADYLQDANNVKAVFLLGHVPIPYSGNSSMYPDGHSEHAGAWPADSYYGDMDGTWTDSSTTWTSNGDRQDNIPGDGKFDSYAIASDIELQVGRVDLSDMPCFSQSETELLRQYLNKDHNYRMKAVTTQPRGLVDDNFGDFSGEAFAADGWRNFGHMFGAPNVFEVDWFSTLAVDSYQWAYGCGSGTYQGAGGVGNCYNFAATDTKVTFTMLFGSYNGDWDVANAFMRSALGTTTYTLSCSWGGRPHNFYHFMTIGETLGECMRRTQNNSWMYQTAGFGTRQTHIALMGDPSLRLHIIAPASGLRGEKSGGQTTLNWTGSPEAGRFPGYHVYRATNPLGPYTRLTASLVASTNYTDVAAPAGSVSYMVRPFKLQVSTAGSYTNAGQGIFTIVGDVPGYAPMGTPIAWLIANVGVTNDYAAMELQDPDGDRLATWEEYRAGTDPDDVGSVFKILGCHYLGPSNEIIWYGTTNSGVLTDFAVDLLTNLMDRPWQRVGSNLTRSATGINTWTHTNSPSEPPVFYRVVIP